MKIEIEGKAHKIDPDEWKIKIRNEYGRFLKFYDDGNGPLWIFRNSMGIVGVVRAQTEGGAYECCEDELMTPIEPAEVYEAYGFNSQAEYDAALRSPHKAKDGFDLVEGYSYQANSSPNSTGIVSHDLNGEALDLLTPELMDRLELTLILVLPEK